VEGYYPTNNTRRGGIEGDWKGESKGKEIGRQGPKKNILKSEKKSKADSGKSLRKKDYKRG